MNSTLLTSLLAVSFVCTRPILAEPGGSLTPPSTTPAPTMKTLDQVEARIPITTMPVTISEPGSYYLTKNFSGVTNGISVISTSNVTIDLNGYTIQGSGSGTGIFIRGVGNAAHSVQIKNGILDQFSIGVQLMNANNCQLNQLSFTTTTGVLLNASAGECSNNMFIQCRIKSTSVGFDLNADGNKVNGNLFYQCQIIGAYYGIYLHSDSSGECCGNIFQECHISDTGSYGVYMETFSGPCNGNVIRGCSLSDLGSDAIYLHSGTLPSAKCDGNTIQGNSITRSSGRGIQLSGSSGNVISDNTIQRTREKGFHLLASDSNRIENNHITGILPPKGGSAYALYVESGTSNLIIKNTSLGQSGGFHFGSSSNVYGPVISTFGNDLQTSANSWANIKR